METLSSKDYFLAINSPFNTQKWDAKENSRIRRSLTIQAKVSLLIAVIIVTMIVIVVIVCFVLPKGHTTELFWPSYDSPSKLGKYGKAAISTDAAPCAPIGREILERNGTAVDAAIAVLVCMGAHNPHSMGLGGGFLMLYYNRTEQRMYYIDSREMAPRNSYEDMFNGNKTRARTGGLAIAVPGELSGYIEVHRKFGSLPWKDLFTPTITMCKNGIEVSRHLERAIRKSLRRMEGYENIRNMFLKNDTNQLRPYKAGERIRMPQLARTLQIISEMGMKSLYGPSKMADQFLQDLKDAGSIIDQIDIQSYSPKFRQPVKVGLRNDTTLYSVSVPGSGALLAFMLSVLDGYRNDMNSSISGSRKKTSLAYHRMVETLKYGYGHRFMLEDEESQEMERLVINLTSPEYAAKIRRRINDHQTYNVSHYLVEPISNADDRGTAHLSIVAANGDAVSVTSTINDYFGSMVMSPSTGIILNNEMDDFSSPNITNTFGVPSSNHNRIRPGKRPLSSMVPMILLDKHGDVKLVLGGNGGTKITSGVLQVAVRHLYFGDDIKQSIDAPRIHHQLLPNEIAYEELVPEALLDNLRTRGHKTWLWDKGMMSIIMGIARGNDGYLYANSDYRKGGAVDGLDEVVKSENNDPMTA